MQWTKRKSITAVLQYRLLPLRRGLRLYLLTGRGLSMKSPKAAGYMRSAIIPIITLIST